MHINLTPLIIVFFVQSSTRAAPENHQEKRDCAAVLTSGKLSANFENSVTHGVHSLTVEDLQLYFNKNATDDNNIPTINMDLVSTQPILNNAPRLNQDKFKSFGMTIVDRVLSHMDNKMWDGKNLNTVDRIVHAFHMHEMWQHTSMVYKEVVSNPPTDPNFCSCLKDVENNGIFHTMRQAALMMREPELLYNANKRMRRGEGFSRYVDDKHVKFGAYASPPEHKRSARALFARYVDDKDVKFGAYASPPERKRRATLSSGGKLADQFLFSDESTQSSIVDEKTWIGEKTRHGWTAPLQPWHHEMQKDLALFLYCMLETPNTV